MSSIFNNKTKTQTQETQTEQEIVLGNAEQQRNYEEKEEN